MATTRNSQIATIKIAVKQLCMDDATYRQMLNTVAGVGSAADLDYAGRNRVIDHLKRLGAKIVAGNKTKGRPATIGRDAQLQKIEAQLADMGLPWSYANAIAENITGGKAGGIKRLAWVRDTKHLQGVIAALAYEQQKRGQLGEIDRMLATLGQTRADIDALIAIRRHGYASDWTRDKRMLASVHAYLVEQSKGKSS